MKTAGSSLAAMIRSQITDDAQVAPDLKRDHFWAYVMNPLYWTGLLPADMSNIRYVAGHFPFLTHELITVPHVSFAVFRDPVARIVSHLGELQREEMPHRSFEDIYSDPKIFAERLDNLQARVFAFDSRTAHSLFERTFEWNEERLELAKSRLRDVDIIGMVEELDVFFARLEETFGWKFGKAPRLRGRRPGEETASPELVDRIRRDAVWDIRFYEDVKLRYAEQLATRNALRNHG